MDRIMDFMPYSTNHSYFIRTLGHFDVIKDNKSMVANSSDAKKIWELYKFMVTHRSQSFTPEALADQLWIHERYSDPRSTLRRQMYRLRQILNEKSDPSEFEKTTLNYHNGYYFWNQEIDAEIDADLFEMLVTQAHNQSEMNLENQLDNLRKAVLLYKGDYLPDCLDQHWVFPVRNYYRRLYIKAVTSLIERLIKLGQFDEIILICQSAIKIDVYEISFHMAFMKALLQKNQIKQAMEHYQYITGFLYREMGVKPTPEMKEFYKQIIKTNPSVQGNHESLKDALNQNEVLENAFYCEPDVFKSIYELERRRSARSGNAFSVAVLNCKVEPADSYAQDQHRINQFKTYLLKKLRKGDVVTQWNERQFVLLLPGLETGLMEKVLNRIISGSVNSNLIEIDYITNIHQALEPHS